MRDMKLNAVLIIIIGIFLISFISAESIGTFKIKDNVELYQTCNNCTYCNLTSIKYPNATSIINDVLNMTKDGTYYHYTLPGGNTSVIGVYKYCYDCGNTIEKSTGCIDFSITGTGYPMDSPKATLYIGLLALLVLLFIVDVLVIPNLPSKDNYDEEGVLISINQMKYVRPILWVVAYLLLMALMFIGGNVALAYMGETLIGKVLFAIARIMLALMLPFLVIWFIYIFYNIFQDNEMKKYIERGVIDTSI